MRAALLGVLAVLALSISVSADMTRETTTTTTYAGTVSDISPSSSTIVVRSEAAPQTITKYVYNDHTVWVDPAGNTVKMETVQNQPVTVYYQKDGDQMVVTRVITQKPLPPPVVEKRTTTTTTTTELGQ